MTALHGATHWSFQRRIEEALAKAGETPGDSTVKELAKLIHKASKKVFPAAFEALAWLKKLAKQAHEQGYNHCDGRRQLEIASIWWLLSTR